MNFITKLINTVDTHINHFTFDAYHAILITIYPSLIILLIIYFVTLGWLVMRGLIPLAPLSLGIHILKGSGIFILTMHWNYIAMEIVTLCSQLPDHLLTPLLRIENNTPSDIIQGIANFWQQGNNLFTNVWRTSGNDFVLGILFGFLGYSVVTSITAIAIFYLLMAKIALSVLLILAPIFLFCFLWENTRTIFNGWLQLIIKWALTPLFIYVFLAFYLDLLMIQINTMEKALPIPTTASISMFILLGLIVISTLLQSAKMANTFATNLRIKILPMVHKSREIT